MTRRAAIAAACVVLVVGGVATAAFLYFFSGLRTAPKPLALSSPPARSDTPAASSGSLAGRWAVSQGSQAGYRVKEQFVGQPSPHEAVARTSTVTGGFTVQQPSSSLQVDGINFTAQLANLQSVDQVAGYNVAQRDRFVSRSLDVQQYPEATFKAQSAIEPSTVQTGDTVSVSVPGDLTIHGVTRGATIAAQARLNGTELQVNGTTSVTMTDFGIAPPQVPFTTADSHVTIEFQLVLQRAAGG